MLTIGHVRDRTAANLKCAALPNSPSTQAEHSDCFDIQSMLRSPSKKDVAQRMDEDDSPQGSAASVHALSFFLPEHSDASLSGPSEIAMGDGECGDTNDCSTLGDAVMQTTFQDTAESMADGQHPYWKLGASTAALPAYAPPLPCPPVGTDGVALGMPWVPAQPQYGLGYALAAPPAAATIFAKSSAMRAPVPRFQHPVELSQIVRDVLAGRLPSLPLGLKLDVEAVARELQGR